jgi:hypothetical protein
MTLNDLLCRFTGEADITVLDPDTPRAGTYLSGEGALIPAKLRDRKVLRFTIDTELERIIVPDTFFNQIDKMNAVLIANGAEDKKIDYVKYINDAIAKAQKHAPVRKADVKSLKR